MRYILVFPNTEYVGDSAESVLRQISKRQWDEQSRRNIKRALSWRAFVDTGEVVREDLSDEEFLIALDQVGLAELQVTT